MSTPPFLIITYGPFGDSNSKPSHTTGFLASFNCVFVSTRLVITTAQRDTEREQNSKNIANRANESEGVAHSLSP